MFKPSRAAHLKTGRRGESAAALLLRLKGCRILERNFSCPLGEIDIIALKGKTLLFVEVRTRGTGSPVDPLQTVDPVKVTRIVNAARVYLARFPTPPRCRFDVIAVTPGGPRHVVSHIPGAFDTTSGELARGRRLRAVSARRRFPRRGKRRR